MQFRNFNTTKSLRRDFSSRAIVESNPSKQDNDRSSHA
jgi:hypothetical protein